MGTASKTRRLFFALWPSDELRNQIAGAVQPALEGRHARPIRPANLHITLAFLGSVPEHQLDDVIDAGNQVDSEPFELTIARLETWRAAHVACLFIAPLPNPLSVLVEQLRFSLSARSVEVDQKEFRAHVTVAREWRDKRLDVDVGPFLWPVSEFVLCESKPGRTGSEYRLLQSWPLRRKDRH